MSVIGVKKILELEMTKLIVDNIMLKQVILIVLFKPLLWPKLHQTNYTGYVQIPNGNLWTYVTFKPLSFMV